MTEMCVAAANYIVELTNQYNNGKAYSDRISMTCKRLQKLLYFSDILFMLDNAGQSMFSEDFFAWPSGPVIPSVYDEFMQFQDGEMIPIEGKHTPLSPEMKKAIESIFNKTVCVDTYDLVEISHRKGGPWSTAYDPNDINHEQIISKDAMLKFYKGKDILAKA